MAVRGKWQETGRVCRPPGPISLVDVRPWLRDYCHVNGGSDGIYGGNEGRVKGITEEEWW